MTRPQISASAAMVASPGIAAAIAAWAGWGLTSVSLLVLALACALAGGVVGALDRFGDAFIWVSAVWIVATQTAAVLHVPVLAAGWPSKLLVSLAGVVLAWRSIVASTRSAFKPPHPLAGQRVRPLADTQEAPSVAPWWVWLPTVGMVVLAAANRLLPPSQGLRLFFTSGDSIVHTEYALRVLMAGNLSYVDDFYPAGWHTLVGVAIGVSEQDATLTPDLLVRALQASSAATFLLFAVLAAALTRLGFLVAANVGIEQRWLQGLVAAGSGAAVLSTPSVFFAVRPSFQTLIYVGVTVAVALGYALLRPSRFALATIAAAAVATAHGWSLALPAVVVAWSYVAWPLVRRGHLRFVAGTAVIAAVVGAWPIVSSMLKVGLDHASMDGYHETLAWEVLVAGLAATVVLAVRVVLARPTRLGWSVVALASAVTVLEAVLLAYRVGVPLLSYYPLKVLSIPTLMVVPLCLAVVALAFTLLVRPGTTRLAAVTATAWLALLSWSGAQDTISLSLGWREPNDVRDLLRPLYADGANGANHAWRAAPAEYRDLYIRQLLDLYHPTDTAQPAKREPLPLTEECALMARMPQPSVVTLDPDNAAARYGACGFPVRVVDVRAVPPTVIP